MQVSKKGVIVTGASRGLGAALATALADAGARVALVARDRGPLEETVAGIRQRGGDAHALAFDVADKQATYRISGEAAALVGPIDLLIHNASTLGPLPMPRLIDTECEDFAAVLETNLIGPFRLTKAVLGSMLLREQGAIVTISSDAAVNGYDSWGAYGVSKAALDHLARTWAQEAPAVRFVSIDPGEMDTKMHADAMPDADRATLARPTDVAARIADIIASIESVTNGARVVASEWRKAA